MSPFAFALKMPLFYSNLNQLFFKLISDNLIFISISHLFISDTSFFISVPHLFISETFIFVNTILIGGISTVIGDPEKFQNKTLLLFLS